MQPHDSRINRPSCPTDVVVNERQRVVECCRDLIAPSHLAAFISVVTMANANQRILC